MPLSSSLSFPGTQNSELKETLRRTLREYETTLKAQSSRIKELEGLDREFELLHSHNEELQEKTSELELRLGKMTSSRDALSTRVEELTEAIEGRREREREREI